MKYESVPLITTIFALTVALVFRIINKFKMIKDTKGMIYLKGKTEGSHQESMVFANSLTPAREFILVMSLVSSSLCLGYTGNIIDSIPPIIAFFAAVFIVKKKDLASVTLIINLYLCYVVVENKENQLLIKDLISGLTISTVTCIWVLLNKENKAGEEVIDVQ